jgi:hypothetical protein
VTTKAVERLAEAIGGDIAAREQAEIQRAMHTREAQLGCVSTQTRSDPEGYGIRDPGSTTSLAIASA